MPTLLLQLITESIPNLSPLGLDWWIILGGWLPGSLAVVAAFIMWFRSRKEDAGNE